jgi:hypothetical protein
LENAILIKPIKNQDYIDKRAWLGYIFKDSPLRMDSNIIDEDFITESCKLYHANERKENSCQEGWKPLNSKNIHNKIESFCEQKSYDVSNPQLYYEMIKDKHTFINLSSKQLKMTFAELKLYHDFQEESDLQIIEDYINDKKIEDEISLLKEKLELCQKHIKEELPHLTNKWYVID